MTRLAPLHVRRIRGINLRVLDLARSIAFYTASVGLFVDRVSWREAFLQWRRDGEDFVGLFESDRTGWHHLELHLLAAGPQEALADLRACS